MCIEQKMEGIEREKELEEGREEGKKQGREDKSVAYGKYLKR